MKSKITRKSLGAIMVMVVVISLLLVSSGTSIANHTIIDKNIGYSSDDDDNVTAIIIGGIGYSVRVSNPKDVDIIANITINITSSFMGSTQYYHDLSVSAHSAGSVLNIGRISSSIFGRITANITVDDEVILTRNGVVIFGILTLFIL